MPTASSPPPTLLLCSERSGSNLLRCLLDAHSSVYAPNTMALGHLCSEYDKGSGKSPEKWKALLLEASRRINESTFYTGVGVDERELIGGVPEHDASALYLYPYRKGAKLAGAARTAIKEHQGWRVAPFVIKAYPGTKVIVQVRDPRDNAASCKRLAKLYESYHGSIQRAGRMWAKEQQGALRLLEEFGDKTVRFHHYEDLVRSPRPTLMGIFEFLDLPWQESVLEFHILEAAKKARAEKYLANMWAHLDRPITEDSAGRWAETLKPCEVRAVEREAGPLLERFRYKAALRSSAPTVSCQIGKYRSALRFFLVTLAIWFQWIFNTGDFGVPLTVVFGHAVRAHRPFERFRDRVGYRL